MDLRKLKTMIDLVSESNISELEVVEGESKIRISKTLSVGIQTLPTNKTDNVHYIANQPIVHSTRVETHPQETPNTHSAYSEDTSSSETLHQVKCPMVGTFYSSPSPGTEPFVNIGSHVTVGQTMGIVEAMKLLNEIECDKSGVVKQILVENGQPVQYGQPLFIIE